MKCLTIGDPHFQSNNVEDTKIFMKKINDLIDNNEFEFIVVLGDLLHNHEKIHTIPFNLATKFLRDLSKRALTFLLVGNHDYINNQQFLTSNHPFTPFKKWDNLVVCDKPKQYNINDMKFTFCPYVPPGRFTEALNKIDWKNSECIFAHQEFEGCKFNPLMFSEHGDSWDSENPFVVSGHIHDKQWVNENIYYPGTPIQHAFGESSNKTVAILTFRENKKCKIKEVNLELRKKRIIYKSINEIQDLSFSEEELVKLVLKGSNEEIKTFRKSNDYKELNKIVKISFNTITKNEVQQVKSEKKSVLVILKELLETDPLALNAYQRILN